MTNQIQLRRCKSTLTRLLSIREVTVGPGQVYKRCDVLAIYNSKKSIQIFDNGDGTGRMWIPGDGGTVIRWRWDAPWFATLDDAKEWLRTWEGAESFDVTDAQRGEPQTVRATRTSQVINGARAELYIFRRPADGYALAPPMGYAAGDWHVV